MNLTINGQKRQVDEGTSIEALLEQLGLKGRPVAVEVNGKLVRREERGNFVLREGDRVEIVTIVGGGAL